MRRPFVFASGHSPSVLRSPAYLLAVYAPGRHGRASAEYFDRSSPRYLVLADARKRSSGKPAEDFSSRQGAAAQEYFLYFKLLQRRIGGKDPAAV